jgi:hypothetical protein
MSKQTLCEQDILCINLILANVKVLSELVHNIKGVHRQALKQKFNGLFMAAKSYEAMLETAANYDEKAKADLELVYDQLMGVNYTLLEMKLKK